MRFDQQVFVITGASSGIGLATAKGAAARGARVFLIGRDAEGLGAICRDLSNQGAQADFAVADVGEADALEAAAVAAVGRFGRIDVWVHAAGVAVYSRLLDTPVQDHHRLFKTNYWGVVHAAQTAVPRLTATRGTFIVVGSVASDIGTPVLGAYAASKHAVKGYVDSLRIELLAAKSPVVVTLIKPSGIGTPLAEHAANHIGAAARVPPPAYTPAVVVRTILQAARRPMREVTVGGAGRLQILGATLAPRLADRISTLIPPLMKDEKRAPNPNDNLYAAGSQGATRSRFEPSKPFSLYTGAVLHPRWGLGIAAGVALGGLIVRRLSSRRG